MTEYDTDIIEFPEWSQWGEGHDEEGDRPCCACLRYSEGLTGKLGYCDLMDEWVDREHTCKFWRLYAEL